MHANRESCRAVSSDDTIRNKGSMMATSIRALLGLCLFLPYAAAQSDALELQRDRTRLAATKKVALLQHSGEVISRGAARP